MELSTDDLLKAFKACLEALRDMRAKHDFSAHAVKCQEWAALLAQAEANPDEINPHHPTVKGLREQWYKITLIVMHKLGARELKITPGDIAAIETLYPGDMPAILANDTKEGIELSIVSMGEAKRRGLV
jgi:hypothetical protein